MSKKVNPAAVGIFVAGAISILVVTLIVLGSGKIFEKRKQFVTYFKGNVNGLEVGSPVQLGGVKVGRVIKMFVQLDPESKEKVIPVVIELSADRIAALSVSKSYTKNNILSREAVLDAVNHSGLRARLMSKSVLTGQLFVDLEYFKDPKDSYTFPGEPLDGLLQIPSIKNEIEQVLESIAKGVSEFGKIDLPKIVNHMDSLVKNIDAKVAELDVEGISQRAKGTLDKANETFAGVDKLVEDEHIRSAILNIENSSAELNRLLIGIDEENINSVVLEAGAAMKKIKLAADNISKITSADSATTIRLNRTLAAFEEASRSVQQLAAYLKRNPNAILSGKKRK